MKTQRMIRKDRYCVTIASQTNAQKKARVLYTTRASILAAITGIVMAVLISIGAAVFSVLQVYRYKDEAQMLTSKINEQTALIDSSESRLAVLQQAEEYQKIKESLIGQDTETDTDSGTVLAEDSEGASTQSAAEESVLAIPVQTAVDQINESFIAGMDEKISAVKLGSLADEVEVEYSGDVEGDSNTVNNWADVLAIFTVQAGYDLKTLQTITEEDSKQLGQIYDDMNQITIGTETSTVKEEPSGSEQDANAAGDEGISPDTEDTPPAAEEVRYLTKLKVCVTIKTMDCIEYADQCGFDKDQKSALNKLMKPDYNMTFAALLGVDLYDGLNSEQLSGIISGLEPGRIGTTIVQAALTRVGDPYSKGRRGSGNYVDCSYFAYWAYKQAGIILPTSSVEQAKYCHFNGYKIDMKGLQPGDILFWSKTTCNCGRWHEIHHAGIYIGNDMVVEASSCKGRVVIRKLWSGAEWRLYMAARPYAEETQEATATPVAGAETK